jgi:hypothetical protein
MFPYNRERLCWHQRNALTAATRHRLRTHAYLACFETGSFGLAFARSDDQSLLNKMYGKGPQALSAP